MAKAATKTKAKPKDRSDIGGGRSAGKRATGTLERRAAVKKLLGKTDDFIFITGLAGAKGDVLEATGAGCPSVFPLGGAMGAAAAMALGLALAQPKKRVVCVTGEGELLMNVGTLSAIGVLNPPNLSIVCVDNEHYGETGFQESHTARGVDLARIAEGSGIQVVRTVTKDGDIAEASKLLRAGNATTFILVKVAPSDPASPPRSRDAAYNKTAFREAVLGRSLADVERAF